MPDLTESGRASLVILPIDCRNMFIVICIMLAGVAVGFLMRPRKLRFTGNIITVVIWILLFLLGVEVGTDERIVKGIHTLGFEAIVITVGAVAGSCLAAWALWKVVNRKKEGEA